MRAWSLAAVLTACLLTGSCAAPLCVTSCGFTADEVPKGWTCADLQDRESAAMWAFNGTKDPRLWICNLSRYHLQVIDAPSWWSYGTMVSGMTYCSTGTVIIGNEAPKHSALVHEWAHALQGCQAQGPYDTSTSVQAQFHANWDRDGIYDAIENARYLWDGGM